MDFKMTSLFCVDLKFMIYGKSSNLTTAKIVYFLQESRNFL